jgi:HSP20 family protein
MTAIVPKRNRLRTLFDNNPFENWLSNMFEEGEFIPRPIGEWGLPRADIRETNKDFCISIELPGLSEDEVEVKLIGNQLIVSGEKEVQKEQDDERFHRMERHYGSFERTFDLPVGVRADSKSVSAEFDKGVLEIRVPKLEPKPVAKIAVKSHK